LVTLNKLAPGAHVGAQPASVRTIHRMPAEFRL